MKSLFIAFFSLSIGACATLYSPDVVEHSPVDGKYTLSLFTGSIGEDLYTKNFETKAREVCKGEYHVLEKSFHPTTVFEGRHDPWRYNWVIACVKGEG